MTSLMQSVASETVGVVRDMGTATWEVLPECLFNSLAAGTTMVTAVFCGFGIEDAMENENSTICRISEYMNATLPTMFAHLDTQVVAQRDFLGSFIGTEDIRLAGAAMLALPVIVCSLGVGVYTSNQWLNAFLHARSVRLLSNEIRLLRNEIRLLRNEIRLLRNE